MRTKRSHYLYSANNWQRFHFYLMAYILDRDGVLLLLDTISFDFLNFQQGKEEKTTLASNLKQTPINPPFFFLQCIGVPPKRMISNPSFWFVNWYTMGMKNVSQNACYAHVKKPDHFVQHFALLSGELGKCLEGWKGQGVVLGIRGCDRLDRGPVLIESL